MSILTGRMMSVFVPKKEFSEVYGSIMERYIAERSGHEETAGAYDDLAKRVHDINEKGLLLETMKSRKTLYVFPKSDTVEQDKFIDKLKQNSRLILDHELNKWFGLKEVYEELVPSNEDPLAILLKYFNYVLYGQHLSFAKAKSAPIYLTISPGEELKSWFCKTATKDTKLVLDIYKNKNQGEFDSVGTFVVETPAANTDELDIFLKEHLDTIIHYEHIAWLGNLATAHPEMEWPSDLNNIDVFNKWFSTNIYGDSVHLS